MTLTVDVMAKAAAVDRLDAAVREGRAMRIREHRGEPALYAGEWLIGRIVEVRTAREQIGQRARSLGRFVTKYGKIYEYVEEAEA